MGLTFEQERDILVCNKSSLYTEREIIWNGPKLT